MPQDIELKRVVFEGISIPSLETEARQFIRTNNLPRDRIFAYIEKPQSLITKDGLMPPSYTLIYR
ncbi:hypothetical protein HYX15_01690 [Candidatus Woesearchaeota archaeon]|nr:hypothetical protein [Candidatus Woesearchaeota archaeon]